MRKSSKIIVTCAPTGSIHTPSMSPHLPVTPDAIARSAIEAAEAGAAILHLHARNPLDGRPSPAAEDFLAFLPQIEAATDAVINISTGGSATMSLDERLEGAKAVRPELCSLNMGPLIFDFSAAAARVGSWQHAWERPYVEGSRDRIMYNSNGYIERIMREIGQAFGTRFEFECYDIGHLYTLAHFADRRLIEPPFLIQGVFGILGGIGADPR
ncbi:MAG: 3-keto-5-aminohexanoate cleavage protein, partial [Steroidobacteraceae bacterium]